MDAEWTMEVGERLAKLEELARQGKDERSEMKVTIEEMHDEFKSISGVLGEIRQDLAKYRGMWGGIMLMCGAVWAFLEMFGTTIVARLKGEV